MATINLGAIKFNWKGAYSGATAYVVDDVVESSGSSYICIAATTGNAPPNASYWEQMSSAGTNGTDGTDLTTTLTTQGDLVYRDGSGLQRLGAGTSGQVLQTNGTGANPSWGTVSSDFVKLATATASNSSTISFEDYYSSTYQTYQIVGYGIQYSVQGDLYFQLATGAGKTYATTNYYSFTHGGYTDFGSTYNGQWADGNSNSGAWISHWGQGTSAYNLQHLRATFYDLNSTSGVDKSFDVFKRSSSSSWAEANIRTSGRTQNTTTNINQVTGIKVYPSSGNFVQGKFTLYGIK